MVHGSALYGFMPSTVGLGAGADLRPASTAPGFTGTAKDLVSPNNPLFWAGAILLVTVGAAGVAGSVRVGKAKLQASLDEA